MIKKTLIVTLVLVLVVLAVWWVRERTSEPFRPQETVKVETTRDVTLYFASPDASTVVPESRQIRSSEGVLDNMRSVLEALVSGPTGTGVATIPPSVRVLGAYIYDKTAYVDFSKEIVEDFTGGTAAEYMLIASIVQTICGSFPEVMAVQILVEGREIETVGGHLSVARPLQPKDWR
jgi:germination protein M